MPKVFGKTVLIFGASGGMGSALANLLEANGVRLILVDRQQPKRQKKDQLAMGAKFMADVSDYRAVRRLAARLHRAGDKLDWIVNLVGWADRVTTLREQSRERIDKLVAINLLATIYVTRELTPLLRSGGGMINIASTAGLHPNGRYAVYSAAKAGVVAFTQAMARSAEDMSPSNLSFVALCPGPTNTLMRKKLVGDAEKHQSPVAVAQVIEKILLGAYRNGDVVVVEKGHSRLVCRQ